MATYRATRTAIHAAEAADANLATTKPAYEAQEDKARADLKAGIDAAQAVYVTAVKAAFTAYSPATEIPASMLIASGKGHGFGFGHLNTPPSKNHAHPGASFHHNSGLHLGQR